MADDSDAPAPTDSDSSLSSDSDQMQCPRCGIYSDEMYYVPYYIAHPSDPYPSCENDREFCIPCSEIARNTPGATGNFCEINPIVLTVPRLVHTRRLNPKQLPNPPQPLNPPRPLRNSMKQRRPLRVNPR